MSSASAANKPESNGKTFLRPYGDTQLDRLRDRLDYLHDRVGSDAALQRHVEAVLTQTLRQCSAGRPEELATILAPAIMTALRDEIRYSPASVADVVKPLAGPMARGAVSSALDGLIRTVATTAAFAISPWRWFGMGRQPGQDKAASDLLVVRDVLVIHRATGLLVSREPISTDQGRTVDADYIAEATSAIVSFVRRAFSQSEPGGPAVLSFGERQWMVRADHDAILAFSYSGREPTGLARRFSQIGLWLERTWGSELRQFAGPLPADRERALSRDLRVQMAGIEEPYERPSQPTWRQHLSRWIVIAALLAATSAFVYWRVQAFNTNSINKLAVSVVEGHPDLLGYPIEVFFDRSTDHVVLQGLMPNRLVADSVVDSLTNATGYPVVRMFGILSADRLGTDERPVPEVMAELGSNVRALGEELSLLASSVAESERADTDWRRVQSERLGRLSAQVAPALPVGTTGPGSDLARWGAENRIIVDTETWTIDPGSLQGLAEFADQIDGGRYIGLRPVEPAPGLDQETIDRSVQLVREQLVRLGFDDRVIVDRFPVNRDDAAAADNQTVGSRLSIALDVVDVSRF